jgi:hypothetical protein
VRTLGLVKTSSISKQTKFYLAFLNALSNACSYSSALPFPYETSPLPFPTKIKTLLELTLLRDVTLVTESDAINTRENWVGSKTSSLPGSKYRAALDPWN